jgi:hypothetical protein
MQRCCIESTSTSMGRDDLGDLVAAQLGGPDAVLVIHDTGF